MNKTYLGDGVYAAIENGMIKLTTENGISPTNTIYLEPQVYDSLTKWVAHISEQATEERRRPHEARGSSASNACFGAL